jgi:cytochrome c5
MRLRLYRHHKILRAVLLFAFALTYVVFAGHVEPVLGNTDGVTSIFRPLSQPAQEIKELSVLVRPGFHNKQCINCHGVGGAGGLRGPALDNVATRLTGDQLVRQVIQGSGNMPAYGKNLSPAEVTALVSFMRTLHKPTEVPARDASQPEQKAEQNQTSLPARGAPIVSAKQ